MLISKEYHPQAKEKLLCTKIPHNTAHHLPAIASLPNLDT